MRGRALRALLPHLRIVVKRCQEHGGIRAATYAADAHRAEAHGGQHAGLTETDDEGRLRSGSATVSLGGIVGQDLEPDPGGSGGLRIREGVAEDRRVSVEDKEIRHGRKTKSTF